MNHVITISREFGSGGRELGLKLAERLGIPFYDKELIVMAAEDSDLAEEAFHYHEETVANLPEQRPDMPRYTPFSSIYEVSMSDQLFLAQSRVIRKLAERGPCVIVGRCSDMVLEESMDIFVYANMKKRVERMLSIQPDTNLKDMERKIRDIDRKRKDYYQYYTGNTWGKAQNYTLCLNAGVIGVDRCLDTVLCYLDAMVQDQEYGEKCE